jgi:hypothetical protein
MKPLEQNALAYVAGFISKRYIKFNKCIACKYNIQNRGEEPAAYHQFIKEKEYGGPVIQRLQYCNTELFSTYIKIYNFVKYILINHPSEENLLKKLVKTVASLMVRINGP